MPNRITNRGSGKTVVNKVSQVPFCYHPTRLLTVILSEHVRTLFKHTFLQFTPGTHIKILLFWRELTGKRKISRPQTLQNTGSSSDGLKDVFLGGSQAGYEAFTHDTWQGSCVVVLRERKKGKGFKPQNRTCVENIFFHVARDHLGMASCSVHLGKLRNAHSSRSCGKKKKTGSAHNVRRKACQPQSHMATTSQSFQLRMGLHKMCHIERCTDQSRSHCHRRAQNATQDSFEKMKWNSRTTSREAV